MIITINPGDKVLVTTDGWFYGKDGKSYRGAWGTANIMHAKDLLGINPSRSTNWYLLLGIGENQIIIAGCQIHYVQKCVEPPVVYEFEIDKEKDNHFPGANILVLE